MREVLVVANRTLGGAKLLEAVRARAAAGAVRFRLVVPQSQPSAGLVIYDEAVRESAQVRVDLALSAVARRGHRGDRRSRRPRPLPRRRWTPSPSAGPTRSSSRRTRRRSSGWLRRDLIERIQNASGLPVEHIVVDLEHEGAAFQGDARARQQDLQRRGADRAPQGARPSRRRAPVHRRRAPGRRQRRAPPREARARLAQMLDKLHAAGLLSSGMIGDPDPYTAVDQRARAVPGRRRRHLHAARRALGLDARAPDRARQQRHLGARSSTSSSTPRPARPRPRPPRRARWRPPASPTPAATTATPSTTARPPANRSSRAEPQLLGMLLFIISEVMVFGAFFTAYFFIRVAQGDPWPATGTHPAGRRRGLQHGDPGLLVVHDPLGRAVDQARQPLRPEGGHAD